MTELTSSLEEQHSRKSLWERVLQHLESKSPSCNSHSEHFSVYFLSSVLWQLFSQYQIQHKNTCRLASCTLLFIAPGHYTHCPNVFETSGKLSAPRSFFSKAVLFQLYSLKQAGIFGFNIRYSGLHKEMKVMVNLLST